MRIIVIMDTTKLMIVNYILSYSYFDFHILIELYFRKSHELTES